MKNCIAKDDRDGRGGEPIVRVTMRNPLSPTHFLRGIVDYAVRNATLLVNCCVLQGSRGAGLGGQGRGPKVRQVGGQGSKVRLGGSAEGIMVCVVLNVTTISTTLKGKFPMVNDCFLQQPMTLYHRSEGFVVRDCWGIVGVVSGG